MDVSLLLSSSAVVGSYFCTGGASALVTLVTWMPLCLAFFLYVCCAGNCWMSGTLPDGLRRLQNVTLINLSNNWLNGTLPAWLSGLMELRVLNLGSNQGGNEGNGMEQLGLGLLGSIPAGIGQLTKLRELNLEANSLSGELPAGLCNGGACGLSSGA